MAKTLDVIANRAKDPKVSPKMGELIDGRFAHLSNPPSLAALKLHEVLFKKAGAAVAEDRWHQIDLAEIRGISGMKNYDRRGLVELFKELRGVVMEYDTDQETVITGLLDVAKVEFEDGTGPTVVRWMFGAGFREVAAKSDYWALIDRQTALSMTSRYALRLYEIVALRANLERRAAETFTVDELRSRLGVPTGKLATWNNLNQFAIKPAIAEINQLSRFTVTATVKKRGRSVVAVEFAWESKPDLSETRRELDTHSAGRKARRVGTVETITDTADILEATRRAPVVTVEAFPASGSIAFGKWGDIVREHAPKPTPDVDRVADAFRKWARSKGFDLASPKTVTAAFIGFCKVFKA